MQLDYTTSSARRFSATAIVSLVMGSAVIVVYDAPFARLGPWPPFGPPMLNWGLLTAAALSVALGTMAAVKRRRLWWLGLIGASLGAMTLAQFTYFVLTFTGFGNK